MKNKMLFITTLLFLCVGIQFGLILSMDVKISEETGILLLISMSIMGVISLITIASYFKYLKRDIEKLINKK